MLLGSGASAAFGLPTMTELTEILVKKVKSADEIVKFLSGSPFPADCETILSVLQTLDQDPQVLIKDIGPEILYFSDAKTPPRLSIAGDPKTELETMKTVIYDACQASSEQAHLAAVHYSEVLQSLSGTVMIRGCMKSGYLDLGIQMSDRRVPLSIFTTNYDLLIERVCEILKIPCSRGFKEEGDVLKRELFRPESIESQADYRSIRLYKLHGSLDFYSAGTDIIRLGAPSRARTVSTGEELHEEMMIYPLHSKYVYSYPYLSQFKDFHEKLSKASAGLIIGHSMRDRGVNDVLTSALITNSELKLVIVDEAPEAIGFLQQHPIFLPKPVNSRCVIIKGRFGDKETSARILGALEREPGLTLA